MQSERKPLGTIRHDWQRAEVESLFQLPFNDLLFHAQTIHRQHFDPNEVQLSTLLSIKTGACPEDCAYCPQSGHHNAEIEKERLLPIDEVIAEAKAAQSKGATRFCMGAAWRSPSKKDFPKVLEMIEAVKGLGMETCMTLGMLDQEQAQSLKASGLDYYNHNLDTSPEYYSDIITTRTYQDRLQTLENVRGAEMKVCCGGIVGMGEKPEDRAELLRQLANLAEHPQSVPVNQLVAVPGTPLQNQDAIDALDFVRTIAVARVMMPASVVRLSAGREEMSAEMQALCFFAGANSIFYGDKLLTTSNPSADKDAALLESLGMHMQKPDCKQASNVVAA